MKLNMQNAHILHKVFGQGKVSKLFNDYITVVFPKLGEKKFVYPDAFEHFMEFSDNKLMEQVLQDIKEKKHLEAVKRDQIKQEYEDKKSVKLPSIKKKRSRKS